ncbi:MAG TPA: dihydrodipicolinate synthase family protein [Chthoniobacteraceae bacterium]|jgi:N-acetylneuraminate lyase|nr:dihydrodipicolinate synthase family protein [Chthoniobacteraceae bacterium]
MPLLLTPPLHGLVVPPHSPFHADGSLNLSIVEQQAAHCLKHRINAVFVAGSTGESSSLTVPERLALTERWVQVTRGTTLRVVVHVGSNCLDDARALAAHAQAQGAAAIAALSPSYFKPGSVEALVRCAAHVAGAAPETPFYFYDIPALTGVNLSMPQFLALAHDRIPTLAGLKFTNVDLASYQFCLRANGGLWDLPWGVDQHLLGAVAMGAKGAVGSSYNYAAPLYHRMLASFAAGDLPAAREAQFQATRLLALMHSYGPIAAAKFTMKCLGIDVGPVRLPNEPLSPTRQSQLRADLEEMGYFDWIA